MNIGAEKQAVRVEPVLNPVPKRRVKRPAEPPVAVPAQGREREGVPA